MLLLLAILAGCGRAGSEPGLGREFTVERGQEVEISGEGLKVLFESVESDSRCPEGANCVWQGYASIIVRLDREGEDAAGVRLHTPNELETEYPSKATFSGYEIRLVDLSPHRNRLLQLPWNTYEATLVVRETQRDS